MQLDDGIRFKGNMPVTTVQPYQAAFRHISWASLPVSWFQIIFKSFLALLLPRYLWASPFGCHFWFNGPGVYPVFQAIDNSREGKCIYSTKNKATAAGANRASNKPASSARKVGINPTDLCIATFSKYNKNLRNHSLQLVSWAWKAIRESLNVSTVPWKGNSRQTPQYTLNIYGLRLHELACCAFREAGLQGDPV